MIHRDKCDHFHDICKTREDELARLKGSIRSGHRIVTTLCRGHGLYRRIRRRQTAPVTVEDIGNSSTSIQHSGMNAWAFERGQICM